MNGGKMSYLSPFCRTVQTDFEYSFLQSNLEPIHDDGEEHGWD